MLVSIDTLYQAFCNKKAGEEGGETSPAKF
jgi:hypothetical protein